jgi:hypothetical protein
MALGEFYNPPSDVVEGRVGRQVVLSRNHQEALGQLGLGDHLYIGLDRGNFWAVGCIDDPREFDAACQAIDQAADTRMYALPDEVHQRVVRR